MELAKLVLEYVKVLAWPAVVLTTVFVFKHELRALVRSVQHLKLPGGAELEWQRELRTAEKAAATVEASAELAPTTSETTQQKPKRAGTSSSILSMETVCLGQRPTMTLHTTGNWRCVIPILHWRAFASSWNVCF